MSLREVIVPFLSVTAVQHELVAATVLGRGAVVAMLLGAPAAVRLGRRRRWRGLLSKRNATRRASDGAPRGGCGWVGGWRA